MYVTTRQALVQRLSARDDFASDDFDVTAQVVHLIGEGQRKTNMAHGVLNAVDFGFFLRELLVVRIGIERSLQ